MSDEASANTDTAQNQSAPDVNSTTDSSTAAAPPADQQASQAPDSQPADQQQSAPAEADKTSGLQRRFSQLTQEKNTLKQQVAELQRQIDAAKPADQQQQSGPPKFADYDTDEAFHEANNAYIAQEAARIASETVRTENTREAQQRSHNDNVNRFNKRTTEVRGQLQDFDNVVFGGNLDPFLTDGVMADIVASDKGPELAYHLGSNLELADRVSRMDPVSRARELGRIEATLSLPEGKKVSSAPDPIKPLGSSDQVQKNPDDMTADEWLAWRRNDLERKGITHG